MTARTGDARRLVGASRRTSAVVTVSAAIGLLCAAVLSYEKYRLLTNPFYVPSCNVSGTVNCTAVMQSEQSSAFGFPNPYLGLVGFAVVLTIGVAAWAGAAFPRWFWTGLLAGILAGLVFVAWLIYQSAFVIGSYCPYCVVVWVVTITLAVAVSLHLASRATRGPATSGPSVRVRDEATDR